MLKHWTSHSQYLAFLTASIDSLDPSQRKRLSDERLSSAFCKLTSLNLDPLYDLLREFYSNTGRPAIHQPEIFRSFILFLHLGETSLTNWVASLRCDDLLAFLIGCSLEHLPPLGSYYDLINRLWLRPIADDRFDQKRCYPFPRGRKPSSSTSSKNKKLPNPHPNVTRRLVDRFLKGRTFSSRHERLLQVIFAQIAVVPSLELGLIPLENLTVSGDGTCVHAHSSPYGKKVCTCHELGIYNCTCNRKFSDVDATWGKDSYLDQYFWGHTLYILSCKDSSTKAELPLLFRFVQAKRNDSVSGIVALAEQREVLPELPIANVCLDSAHDNYPTYELLKAWGINPFIDLNDNRGKPASLPNALAFTDKGTPICLGGYEMVYNGCCYNPPRHKWRCPLACKKVDSCLHKNECSPSPYGRVFYTKTDWDIRLFNNPPRDTMAWKNIYKKRTCSERINNRVVNDYQLHQRRIHGKKRYSFFTMMIGINIHLDARIKHIA